MIHSDSGARAIARRHPGAVTRAAALAAALLGLPVIVLSRAALATGPEAAGETAGEAARNPLADDADAVRSGHTLFNETCAHCHGPDAVTGMSERNLRHLRLRYGDRMAETFLTTVLHGRPDKGMPTWQGVLDDATIWKIYTYLSSIQASDD